MIRTTIIELDATDPTLIGFSDEVSKASSIAVKNISASETVYIGTENVTTSDYGVTLTPDQTLTIDLGPDDSLYAIGSGATVSVLVLNK